jgi:hypothetical protein
LLASSAGPASHFFLAARRAGRAIAELAGRGGVIAACLRPALKRYDAVRMWRRWMGCE